MNKFRSAILGFAVGDALGVPFEFLERGTFKATGMTGYGTHSQPAGTWSDDTSLTLATIKSLCECRCVNRENMMRHFAAWLYCGDFTPYGYVFDVGNTTALAIERFEKTGRIRGGASKRDNGSGSLMRILPLAFISGITADDIFAVSSITHAHTISKVCCWAYVNAARCLLSGTKISYGAGLDACAVGSRGYVVDTLETALWCISNTDNYRDCVLTAVNLGGDTDTVAAVAGGLAGIMYGIGGERGIPEEWIEALARRELIVELCDEFDSIFDSVQIAQC